MNPGQLIGGCFRIDNLEQDLFGRGGMGAVYRATDILTGDVVAIKALDAHFVGGREPSRSH